MEARRVVRRRGSHIFYTIGSQMAVGLSDLRICRPLPPRPFLILISVRGPVDPRAIVRLERIGPTEKSSDIGNRTRGGGEWLSSRPCRLTSGESAPDAHWIRGGVGPRAGLDIVEKRETLLWLLGIEARLLARPSRTLVTMPTELPQLYLYIITCRGLRVTKITDSRSGDWIYWHFGYRYS
jgi:hypothetical protein